MADHTTADAFDRGHKAGFEAGYRAALADAWWIILKSQNALDNIDTEQIRQKYADIFRGLDDPTALEFLQEVIA